MKIRRATEADIPGMLALKGELSFSETEGSSTRGGFLLGSDAEGYRARIAGGSSWVLVDAEGVQGLAIGLDDRQLRASDLWARRDQVNWEGLPANALATGKIGYFDQLALRPGGLQRKKWAAALGLTLLLDLMRAGHDRFAATTVHSPIQNLAAVPWLERIGAQRVGRIDEVYPEIGPLLSDIWLVDARTIRARLAAPRGLAERWVIAAAVEAR